MTEPTQVRVWNNSQYPIVLNGRSGHTPFRYVLVQGDNQTLPRGSADDGNMTSPSDGDFFMTVDVEGIDYQPGKVDDALKSYVFAFQATNPWSGSPYFQKFYENGESDNGIWRKNDEKLWTMLEDAQWEDQASQWVTGDLVTDYGVYADSNGIPGNASTNKAFFVYKNKKSIPSSGADSSGYLGFSNVNDWYEYFDLEPYFKVRYNEATSKAYSIKKWDFYVDNIDTLDITARAFEKYEHQSAMAKDPILHHQVKHSAFSDLSGIIGSDLGPSIGISASAL